MIGSIKVVNRNHLSERAVNTVRVEIDQPSILANPYVEGIHGSRKKVVRKYEQWFCSKMKEPPVKRALSPMVMEVVKIYKELRDGKDIELVCNSGPKRCHGVIIKNWIENCLTRQ